MVILDRKYKSMEDCKGMNENVTLKKHFCKWFRRTNRENEPQALAVGKLIPAQSVLARRTEIGCPCMKLNQIGLQCRWIELQLLVLQSNIMALLTSLSEIWGFIRVL